MKPHYPLIVKPPIEDFAVRPNLDYARDLENFDAQRLIDGLDWLPGGGLNIAHEAIDRHAANPALRDDKALIWQGAFGEAETATFADMARESNRFANVLKSLGIGANDFVFIMLGAIPEFFAAMLGVCKVGAVVCVLPPDSPPELLKAGMLSVDAKVLVTQPNLRRLITPMIPELFELQHIIVVNKDQRDPLPLDYQDLSYEEEMSKAPTRCDVYHSAQDEPAMLRLPPSDGASGWERAQTSDHATALRSLAVGRWWLDLRAGDALWSAAAPGDPNGMIEGALAPWINGAAVFVSEEPPAPNAWAETMRAHEVSVALVTPRFTRALMEAPENVAGCLDGAALRHLAGCGGRFEAEMIRWAQDVLGLPIHDSWGQQAHGTALCANFPSVDIRPGSVGRPLPGVELGILGADHRPLRPCAWGRLSIRPGGLLSPPAPSAGNPSGALSLRRGWMVTDVEAAVDVDGCYWLA